MVERYRLRVVQQSMRWTRGLRPQRTANKHVDAYSSRQKSFLVSAHLFPLAFQQSAVLTFPILSPWPLIATSKLLLSRFCLRILDVRPCFSFLNVLTQNYIYRAKLIVLIVCVVAASSEVLRAWIIIWTNKFNQRRLSILSLSCGFVISFFLVLYILIFLRYDNTTTLLSYFISFHQRLRTKTKVILLYSLTKHYPAYNFTIIYSEESYNK